MKKSFLAILFVLGVGVIFVLAASKTLTVQKPSDSLSAKNSLLFKIGEIEDVILVNKDSFAKLAAERVQGSVKIQLYDSSSNRLLADLGKIENFQAPTRVRWNQRVVGGDSLLVKFSDSSFLTKVQKNFEENHTGSKVSGNYSFRFNADGIDGESTDDNVDGIPGESTDLLPDVKVNLQVSK